MRKNFLKLKEKYFPERKEAELDPGPDGKRKTSARVSFKIQAPHGFLPPPLSFREEANNQPIPGMVGILGRMKKKNIYLRKFSQSS